MEDVFVDINAINKIEEGMRTFAHQMANANSEIEHTIFLYFQDFERCLQILEERQQKAHEDLERAERALERQRNKRVWVESEDGKGHWEQADCSSEEAKVARCQLIYDKCRRDVDECRRLISDARTRRYIHKEKLALFESKTAEAVDKIGPVKELLEKHRNLSVPSAMPSSSRGFMSSSFFPSSSTISRGVEMSRPRPQMDSGPSFGPKPSPLTERPRKPQDEGVNPIPRRPMTESDRPRSPFGDEGRVTRDRVSSFRECIDKIINKYKNDDTNE